MHQEIKALVHAGIPREAITVDPHTWSVLVRSDSDELTLEPNCISNTTHWTGKRDGRRVVGGTDLGAICMLINAWFRNAN